MQTIDFNGKTIGDAFNSATTSASQFVKPRVVIDFVDGRHLSNVSITTNSEHSSNSVGSLGYYFDKYQVVNGVEYETYPWAVAGALDCRGRSITANGKFYTLPSDLSTDLKYGWMSASKSNTYCAFTTNPYVDLSFDPTTINKIKVVTSRELGRVRNFKLDVYRTGNVSVLSNTYSFTTNIDTMYDINVDNAVFENIINLDNAYTDIARIVVTVLSTHNPNDYARIMSVFPMYQVDISDYIINVGESRTRDLHETSLPIAGSSQTSCGITIDNTDKKFNILNSNSDYGKFLKKDLKVYLSYGWKSFDSNNLTVNSYLTSNLTSSDTSIYLSNNTEFPDGDSANANTVSKYYVITLDKDTPSEEKILIKRKASDQILTVSERGFNNKTTFTRRNLITNPSFQINATGWTSAQSSSVRYALLGFIGNSSLLTTMSNTTDSNIGSTTVTVATGPITMSIYAYIPALSSLAGRTVTITAEGGTASLTGVVSSPGTLVGGSWVRCSMKANVTVAGTTSFTARLSGNLTTAVGQVVNLDAALVENSPSLDDYFDGDTNSDSSWVEVAHASQSIYSTKSINHSSNSIVTFDPFEYVDIGTFFIEDISSSTSDMTIEINLNDRFKFLNDKVLDKGFFKENTTVGDAITELLYLGNFPSHKIFKYDRFQDSAVLNDAILHLKFNDENKNINSNTFVAKGLRYRVYQPPSGFEYTIKDLQLDVNEKELSDLDKALGLSASVNPSFVGFKSNVSLISYLLDADDVNLNNKYYQGVFDGYFIPINTLTNEEIGIELDEGGARLYIDDELIIDAWNEVTSLNYYSGLISATSGVPYKIRLEFYHTGNTNTFDLNLTKTSNRDIIESNELFTNIILDHIGTKNLEYNKRNHVIPTEYVVFDQASSISWDTKDKSIKLLPVANSTSIDSFARLPYDVSWNVSNTSTNPNRSWTIEHVVSFANVGGEYISSWSNASSTTGIEFFHSNSTSHGVKLKTLNSSNNAVDTTTITSTTALPEPTGWNHFITTYNNYSKVLTYYVDGIEHGNATLSANIYPEFGSNDLTFGGRGSSFASPTNLLTNPDFDIDTSSWTATGGATISINTSTPYAGPGSLTITSSATNYNGVITDFITISPNTSYYLSAMCRNLSGNTRTVYIGVQWFNSSNTLISEINSAAQGTLSTAAGWVQRFVTGTSPATAVKAKVFLLSGTTGLSAGWTTGFDNVLFEQSSTLRPFDPYTYGGVVKPTNTQSSNGVTMNIDEFIIYPRALPSSEVLKRYRETQIAEVKKFPFLYGINNSIYQAIQDISFAELGRVFIDEKSIVKYDNYNAFFESSIDQHANIQKSISDTDFISDASITKNLQVNSVVIKISGIASNTKQTQPIWRAPDNTTLGVITLTSALSNSSNVTSIPCSGFEVVPFPTSGYIIIDNEIIKYNNKDKLNFLSIERGVLGTTASTHNANSLIREVRYFNFEYDKSPSLNVKNPFITGIIFEDPDEINILHWDASPFKGNLIISASQNIESDNIVFAEGVNPITEKVAFTSVAGIPIEVSENKSQVLEQKAVNSENRRKYGLKEVVIDSPYIVDAGQAQLLADFIINKLSEPIPIIEINTMLIPTIQVGDRIRITSLDQFDIINSDYWVISISTSVGSNYSQSMTLRKVV